MSSFEDSMRTVRELARSRREVAGATLTFWVQAAAIVLVVAVPLVVTPWGSDAYSRPKVLVLYGLASAMALGWVAAYLATGRPRWRLTIPEMAVWTALLAILISTWASVNLRLSLFGAPGRYEGLFAICSYLVLYFVGVHFFGSPAGFRAIATAAGAAACAAITYGLFQLAVPPLFAGEAEIRQWYAGLGVPRPPSTLGSPVVFGGYVAVMTPLALALALSTSGRRRILWLVASWLGYVAAAATLTRGAWLAVGVGTVIFAVFVGGTVLRSHRRALAVMAATVAVSIGLVLTVVGTPIQITGRITSSLSVQSGSLAQRLYIWNRTLALIRSRPLLGWGLETLREVFPYDRPSLMRHFGLRPIIIDKAHNDVLHMAVSIGLPGTAAYVAFWVLVGVAAVRTWRNSSGSARILAAGWVASVVAYLTQAQFSFSTVALAPLIWLFAGASAGWEVTSRGQ